MDDDVPCMAIDFGTFKVDCGLCGDEESLLTMKTPQVFRWEHLDTDRKSRDAFERSIEIASSYLKEKSGGCVMSIPSFQRMPVYSTVMEYAYEKFKFSDFYYFDQMYLAMYSSGRTNGTLLHLGHRSASVVSIHEGQKIYQSRFRCNFETYLSSPPSFPISSKVLPDGTSFETLEKYNESSGISHSPDPKLWKHLSRLVDNAIMWGTPMSRTAIVLAGGGTRCVPFSNIQKKICLQLQNYNSSNYINWDMKPPQVRKNRIYSKNYFVDDIISRNSVKFVKSWSKDTDNEVFTGLSICGSLSMFERLCDFNRQLYEECGPIGMVSRAVRDTENAGWFSGVMVLKRKTQLRFYINDNNDTVSRPSQGCNSGKNALITLLLCFEHNKRYTAQLNLIVVHIRVALLGRPDDALGEREFVESIWQKDIHLIRTGESTTNLADDIISFSMKNSDVIENVLQDFAKRKVVMKFPSRNKECKLQWKTVIDSTNGNVWYYNNKTKAMENKSPFKETVISIGSCYLRSWTNLNQREESPMLYGFRNILQKNSLMMSVHHSRTLEMEDVIRSLGYSRVQYPIRQGHDIDEDILRELISYRLGLSRLGLPLKAELDLIVLTGSTLSVPSRARMCVVDTIFSDVKTVNKVAMFSPSVLASLAMGCVTSCVLSCGHYASQAVSIFDGCCLPGNAVPTYVAGRDVTDLLIKQYKNLKTLRTGDRLLIRAIKDSCRSGDRELILPDGQRFLAQKIQDAMFDPLVISSEKSKRIGVHDAVRRSIGGVKEKSVRKIVSDHVVLEGGPTNAGSVRSFESRLEKSLSEINAQVLRTAKGDEDGPEWRAMKGGKVAAEIVQTWNNSSNNSQVVLKEEYEEFGPSIFLRKYGWW